MAQNNIIQKVYVVRVYTVPRKLDSSMGKFLQTSPYYGQ